MEDDNNRSWDEVLDDENKPINSKMDAAAHCLFEYTYATGGISGYDNRTDLRDKATELMACIIRYMRDDLPLERFVQSQINEAIRLSKDDSLHEAFDARYKRSYGPEKDGPDRD